MKKTTITLLVCLLSACSATQNKDIERRHYGSWEKDIGYTQVVKVGNNLYISGVTNSASTFDEQVKGVYSQLEKILSDYGADFSHVTRETLFTTDMEAMRKAQSIRKAFFKDGLYPSSSWIEVKRLYLPPLQIEVEMTVQLP